MSVDISGFDSKYYSVVSDLLETTGPESSGIDDIDKFAEGAWMPECGMWMGLVRDPNSTVPEYDSSFVHIGEDGHVVVLNSKF